MQSWDDLEPAWHEAFRLAWEAYAVPTIPVGAVVTDAQGTVMVRARNRIFDTTAPAGQIFGSRVAHAEVKQNRGWHNRNAGDAHIETDAVLFQVAHHPASGIKTIGAASRKQHSIDLLYQVE